MNTVKPSPFFHAIIVLFPTLIFGCASGTTNISAVDLTTVIPPKPAYTIQPGDKLDIKLFYNPELNESLTVRPDGKISLQLIDEIQASGLTPAELDLKLTGKYSKELKQPAVTVIVRSFISQKVYVGGEVTNQGFVELTSGMTPLQAVLGAGGLKETGDPSSAILIRKGHENQPVAVRVNLKKAIYGGKQTSIQLHPQDVVYIPKTTIAEVNKFVTQYIVDLLLFRGVSLGFSYNINNED